MTFTELYKIVMYMLWEKWVQNYNISWWVKSSCVIQENILIKDNSNLKLLIQCECRYVANDHSSLQEILGNDCKQHFGCSLPVQSYSR